MIGYTRANVRSLVDALVPRTPELAESHGPEHVPGALDIGLEEYVIESFNNYQEHHLGPLSTVLRRFGVRNYPYAIVVALLLDFVALELLVRRDNEDPVAVATLSSPFGRLSREDRLRAVDLLEIGALDSLAAATSDRLPVFGTVRFLALGATTFPLLGYYSEWPATDPRNNPGWQQTEYPGPREGYSEHMGYEVESFEETYEIDDDPADGDEPDPDKSERPDDSGGEA